MIRLKIFLFMFLFLSISFTTTMSYADINKGLVGWWKLDEGSGTSIADSSTPFSGTTNNGTLATTYTWVSSGKVGGYLTFTGGYAATSYVGQLNDFTVCAWFNSSSDTSSARIVDKSYSGGFWLGHETTGAANQWGGGVLEGSSPYGRFVTLTNGYWHHICSVRSGTTHYIYGDGGAVSTSGTVSSTALDASSLYIGASNIAGNQIAASIDDVRIYNRALSQAEIYDLYYRGSLVAWWKFDDNSGTSAADSSGNAYTGTLVNTPSWVSARRNYGVSFNGTSQYMTQTLKPSYLSGTLTAWVYPTATHTNSYVFMSANASTNRVYLQWFGSFNCVRGGRSITAKASAALNTWHFIACSWDSSTVYAYYNGAFVTSAAYTDSGGAASAYIIGSQPGCGTGGGCYIPATLDDLRVYDRKLTTAEIRQIYQGSNVKANLDGN